ncbi:MAG TPA: hypothetical protein VJL37_05305 [Flavobacterium sp.]|nr:hypothetical protein [Flavobacterium sp.]
MKEYSVRKYQPTDYTVWNQFVSEAKNGTFLFHRDFMEYHNDRFEDFSMLVFDQKNNLTAIIPANVSSNEVISHQGLTYGGFVLTKNIGGTNFTKVFQSVLTFLQSIGIASFTIKMQPPLYSEIGNGGLDFCLFQKGINAYRKDMALLIDYSHQHRFHKSKEKHWKKFDDLHLEIREESSLKVFWEKVLVPRLSEKHQSSPVHTLEEIEKLKALFPYSIRQFSIYKEETILAGITIFEFSNGVKSQYGATTQEGEENRALDFLFMHLIEKFKREGKRFFDMGIVNDGTSCNEGLLKQKEELGCVIYTQDHYKIIV